MAERLANLYGTEKDKVNCPFFFKIGACRHGDRCSRMHNRPIISETLLLKNMYLNPALATVGPDGQPIPSAAPDEKSKEVFEDFYEDVLGELSTFGKVEELNVCDNLGEHLVGNVYCRFDDEECAEKAAQALQGRFYGGRPLMVEFSPVTDFREARCRQYDIGQCNRGGFCNFMHLKEIPEDLERELFPDRPPRDRGGRDDRRGGGRGGFRGGGGGRDYGRPRDYDRGRDEYRDRGGRSDYRNRDDRYYRDNDRDRRRDYDRDYRRRDDRDYRRRDDRDDRRRRYDRDDRDDRRRDDRDGERRRYDREADGDRGRDGGSRAAEGRPQPEEGHRGASAPREGDYSPRPSSAPVPAGPDSPHYHSPEAAPPPVDPRQQ